MGKHDITYKIGGFCYQNSTGKEKDTETGYGYFGARYMDHELMTMWLSVDPMSDKYPCISPYAYCAWNPVKLVDPDGREVLPMSDEAYEMILKTLPIEARSYVKRDANGYIDRDIINSYDCESSNFKDLKKLVNLDCTIEVSVSSTFDYIDNNGSICNMNEWRLYPISIDESAIDSKGVTMSNLSTGEVGFMGATQYPESASVYTSTNENVKVHVNSQLSMQGRAEVFAHEFYGHAFIYATTCDVSAADHKSVNISGYGMSESNELLKE